MARSKYIYLLIEHDYCDRIIHGAFTVKKEGLAKLEEAQSRAEGTVYLERYNDGLVSKENLR